MSEQAQLPSESEFNAFIGRLREFRKTLPEGDQRMLDAMAHAAFKGEGQDDVQGYWMAVGYDGRVLGAGPGNAPGFWSAPPPPPVYAVSPFAGVYPYYAGPPRVW